MSKRISDGDGVGKEKEAVAEADRISSGPSSNRALPYVAHQVGLPPKQSLFQEFTARVKETFFADQPLRSFKDQSKSKKFRLGVEALFPIFSWARDYNLTKLRGDAIAGLTIASLCIPQVRTWLHVFYLAISRTALNILPRP